MATRQLPSSRLLPKRKQMESCALGETSKTIAVLDRSQNADEAEGEGEEEEKPLARLPVLLKDKRRAKALEIERENRFLLQYMRQIMVKPDPKDGYWNTGAAAKKDPKVVRRNARLREVANENLALLKLLLGVQSTEHSRECKAMFEECMMVVGRIKKYESEWKGHQMKKTAPKLVDKAVKSILDEWGGFSEPPSQAFPGVQVRKRSKKELDVEKALSSPYVPEEE